MTGWLYVLLFIAVAVIVFCGPYICAILEQRAAARDAETWARMPGAVQ